MGHEQLRAGPQQQRLDLCALDSHGAWAFADWSQNAIINNSGLIAARGGASARGLTLHNGGVVVNRSGGSILAEGPDAVAVYFGRGHYQVPGQSPTATDLTNWGHIEAQSTGATLSSVAVYLAHLSIESMVIDNHGTIVGDFAIYSDPTAFTPPQNSAELVTNESDGIITGEISLDLGDDRIVNNGQITGYIDMGAGNDVVDDRLVPTPATRSWVGETTAISAEATMTPQRGIEATIQSSAEAAMTCCSAAGVTTPSRAMPATTASMAKAGMIRSPPAAAIMWTPGTATITSSSTTTALLRWWGVRALTSSPFPPMGASSACRRR